MNIRRRLLISNLLMIVVPVVISLLVGVAIIFTSWALIAHGTGLGRDTSVDFERTTSVIAERAAEMLASPDPENIHVDAVESMLDASDLSLIAVQDGLRVWSYGDFAPSDKQLLSAVSTFKGNALLISDGRSLSMRQVDVGNSTYEMYLLGSTSFEANASAKVVMGVAGAVLVVALVATAVVTNQFLTRFVLRNVTDPLDELVEGVRQIGEGNLDVCLPADRRDEFAPVFESFNGMARRLKETTERDHRIEEERRTLLIGLSHDLRSPLTSIQAYVEGLQDGIAQTPEARERYLGTIKAKADEMQRMLRQISSVARVDFADAPHLEVRRIDEVVHAWVRENREDYELRGVVISCECAPASARIDTDLFDRLLINVADNAEKYARRPAAPCRLRISVSRDDEFALITVEDDGPGVPDEELPRLFDLFYRSDAARRDPSAGNGIGLSVVERGVLRMGGWVRAERAELGGLAVLMGFPLLDSPEGSAGEGKQDA